MAAGVSDAIAAHVAGMRFEALPAATVAAAKQVLLDATGVMLGASGIAAEPEPFIHLAMAQGSGPCAILGTGLTTSAAQAAFANGALAHALDYEDAFDLAPGHPNASLVPVLLALAQAERVDGRHFLTALAVGCDVSCRIALALRRPMEAGHWYPPPIVAAFGAAAGAANLLGLDAQGVRDALSLVLCQATMPGEIKHSRGTVIRAVREAFPAQAAVVSALLARDGVTGFEEPLEGKGGFYALYAGGEFDPADLTGDLGERFWIEHLTFKPWPSCRGTHAAIELALELRGQAVLADIARVVVEMDEVQRMLTEPLARKQAPATAIDAKFSIPFCAALALAEGEVGLDSFVPGKLGDPAILALAANVEPRLVDDPSRRRGAGGAMELHLHGGRVLRAEVANALGCPERPLGRDALIAKFVACAARARHPLAPAAAEGLAATILNFEACDDAGSVFAL